MKSLIIAVLSLFVITQAAHAGEYLTADEAKAAFTNKTFDGIYLPKSKKFKGYEGPDGSHNIMQSNGDRDEPREWKINDKGQHCTTLKSGKWRCSFVKDAGNGELHKFNDKGEHTHTLSNFRDGNQL